MSKAKRIDDVLRVAIQASGLTHYRIAKDTGAPATSIMRFVRGETSLRLDRAAAIAELLGLELMKTKPKATKRSK